MKNKTQKYIVRTDRAGVFFCEIAERRGSEADLVNARRIHRWAGATECIGLALHGVTRPESCRFTDAHNLTVLGVIEVIPCTEAAIDSLASVGKWTV